jgi:hypothetical protein
MIPVRLMAWIKRFVDPIILPDGRELLTLRDAAEYITAPPKAEHDAADWQVDDGNAAAGCVSTTGRKCWRGLRS